MSLAGASHHRHGYGPTAAAQYGPRPHAGIRWTRAIRPAPVCEWPVGVRGPEV